MSMRLIEEKELMVSNDDIEILDEWFGIEELNTTKSYMKHYKPLREYIDSLKTYLDANWEIDWIKYV
jgi:hypothetical protein